MIPKNKELEFLTFNDGIVDIYDTNNDDEIISDSLKRYYFGNRTVGVKRFYAAYQNDITLKKVIHIHFFKDMTSDKAVVIDNTRYNVEQVQFDKNSNPPCTILSLSQRGLYRGETDVV